MLTNEIPWRLIRLCYQQGPSKTGCCVEFIDCLTPLKPDISNTPHSSVHMWLLKSLYCTLKKIYVSCSFFSFSLGNLSAMVEIGIFLALQLCAVYVLVFLLYYLPYYKLLVNHSAKGQSSAYAATLYLYC